VAEAVLLVLLALVLLVLAELQVLTMVQLVSSEETAVLLEQTQDQVAAVLHILLSPEAAAVLV
jgi:hypothetical protein